MPTPKKRDFLTERLGLAGKVAAVSGGAGGIGLAVSQELAEAGVQVAVCDVDPLAVDRLERSLQSRGSKPLAVTADVRQPKAVAAFFDAVAETFGRLDILVIVPGGTFTAPFEQTRSKGWDILVQLNFTHVLTTIQSAIPFLRSSGGGSIVTITSSEAHRGAPGVAVYSGLKAAVESFSRSLAVELAGDGIRVNCVAPDQVPTPNAVRVGAFPEDLASPTLLTSNAVTIPMGRMGAPREIAGCVLFLASDLSSYVTGTTIPVDGGVLAAGGWQRWPDGYSNRLPTGVAEFVAARDGDVCE